MGTGQGDYLQHWQGHVFEVHIILQQLWTHSQVGTSQKPASLRTFS
jgi:hypothetical protein